MTIAEFDHFDAGKKKEMLNKCCGSGAWVKKMLLILPVQDLVDLLEYAEEEWYECNPADWLEAFQQHIPIGDIHSLDNSSKQTTSWASKEQSGVIDAPANLIRELADANESYEETFGYRYIIDATGKSAREMLDNLNQRLLNDPHDELVIAAGEQNKITQSRLQKLFA